MNRMASRLVSVATVASLSLVAAGCGRGEDSPQAGAVPGVTAEPCPGAVNQDKGCIYLGTITDLTGTLKGLAEPITAGQRAFWANVNAQGGVGDYEVDMVTHLKDSAYDPEKHAAAYSEIKDKVVALGQSLGTAQTGAILAGAKADNMLIVPASLGSNWLFQDNVAEFGSSYCAEGMNMVDYSVDSLQAKAVMAIHWPGDYGDDSMVGARTASEARGVSFSEVTTGQVDAGDDQKAVIQAIMKTQPDVVVLAVGPKEMATIVGGSAAAGFKGKFIGAIPTWNAALVGEDSPAAPAIEALYLQASSFPVWESEVPGYVAMRKAVPGQAPNDWFALGWAGGYVMKAVLEKAIAEDKLNRAGVLEVSRTLTEVASDGMLPAGSGNYAGDGNAAATRVTQINKVDQSRPSKMAVLAEPFTGPTAQGFTFTDACYLQK